MWKAMYAWLLVVDFVPEWVRSERSGGAVLWDQAYRVPFSMQRLSQREPFPRMPEVLELFHAVLDRVEGLTAGDGRVVEEVRLLHARFPLEPDEVP